MNHRGSALLLLALAPFLAKAEASRITCELTDQESSVWIVEATIDKNLDQSEIRFYEKSLGCTDKNYCTKVTIEQQVLPATIVLSSGGYPGGYTRFELDRQDLTATLLAGIPITMSFLNREVEAKGACSAQSVENAI